MAGPDPTGLESDPIGVLADRLGPAQVRGQFALGGVWQCPPPWHPQGGAVTPRRGLSLRGWGSGPFHRDLSRPSGRPKRPSPRGSGQRASGQLLRGAGESWPLGLPRGSLAGKWVQMPLGGGAASLEGAHVTLRLGTALTGMSVCVACARLGTAHLTGKGRGPRRVGSLPRDMRAARGEGRSTHAVWLRSPCVCPNCPRCLSFY